MTKTVRTLDGSRTIVDEMCYCGHLKSEHLDRFGERHGPCTDDTCECYQFTWKEFIFDDKS